MQRLTVFVASLCSAIACRHALADVEYDSFGTPVGVSFTMDWEYAEDVWPAGGAGTLIDSVDFYVQQLPANPFVGSMQVSLYEVTGAGGVGTLLATSFAPAPTTLNATTLTFDFAEIPATVGAVWVSWAFKGTGYLGVWMTDDPPSIGVTTPAQAHRSGTNPWFVDPDSGTTKPMLRVHSVPSPATVVPAACAIAFVRRRRI